MPRERPLEMLIAALVAALSSPCTAAQTTPAKGQPIALPVVARNDTFYAAPFTASGFTLMLYTDSGGGGPFLFADSAKRAGLKSNSTKITFSCSAWIPIDSPFAIAPASMRQADPIDASADGILGGAWFDGKTWTWNYPTRRLYWIAQDDVPNLDSQHVVALGFQTSGGNHTTGFPRIEAAVGGQTYAFLLDTGAHTKVTQAAHESAAFPNAPFAASFIAQSIFDRWHAAHPDWAYLRDAEVVTGAAMIRVPAVTVGGYTVGPVWFVARPDKNFKKLSRSMDAPVVGALGGSALHYFRLTVDYPNAKAYFERPWRF